ncbi:MAG TPA: glycosyltransferase family 1 protein [Solirubrobacteraceae bacterium]|nr:glycosyltransferase family 1 protein [Solirubrobacteraceae bacterium]
MAAAGRPIVLNHRAATRPTITGVERWTAEVIPRLVARRPGRYVVAEPPPRARSRALAQTWEQTALPAQAARGRAALIFSPANLAPLAWPRNVLVMHDAAVLREPGAYSRAYRLWHRYAGLASARRAVAVVTVSEFSRGELLALAGLEPSRVHVVPGGVSPAFTPQADAAGAAARLGLKRPYVLTIATEDRRKNLPALAVAARRLADAGIELVRAGDARGYFVPELEATGIRPLGYVPDADLPGLYAGALAFVLPSRYEGFGLTCLEAMACGVPVVAADRAALPETCGGAATLVDPDDAEAVAAAVLGAAQLYGTERAAWRVAGLARAAEFTWERTADALDRLLIGLADGMGARG